MLEKLKAALVAMFAGVGTPEATAVSETLSRWGLDFGFDRTGNSTAHKSLVARGEAQSRVSLDKYVSGQPCIIVNRMLAQDWRHVFASALHGAILAWRSETATPDEKGRVRLLDAPFTDLARKIGLVKVADEVDDAKAKDGKRKVSDTQRRAWYGLTYALEAMAAAFAKDAGPLPDAYIGTTERNTIGTILLPASITQEGVTIKVFVRIPSYTAAVAAVKAGEAKSNAALDEFKRVKSVAWIVLDAKNKGYRLLQSFVAAEETPAPVLDIMDDAKASVAAKAPKGNGKARKPQPAATV